MMARVLDPSEWDQVWDPGTQQTIPWMRPGRDAIVGVFDDAGALIGTWTLLQTMHVEGAAVHEAYQGRPDVLFCLLGAMKEAARTMGHRRVVTTATDPKIARMCQALGGETLPGTHYSLPVET